MGELREAIRASLERHIAESGYSQKEIAEKLGVSKSSVTNWIKGKNSPDVELVLPICRLLNISVREFYGEPDIEETPTTKKSPSDISEEARQIAKDYDKLTSYGKGAVRAILAYTVEADTQKPEVPTQKATQPKKVVSLPKIKRNHGITELTVFDEPAAAGLGNPIDTPPSHIEQYPSDYVPAKTNFGVLISGTSMEPRIPDGSTVFVQATPVLDNGEIGIFVLDGKSYCKQLKKDDETQQVKLHSINPDYEDIDVLPFAELRTLGRVLGGYDPQTRHSF